MNTLLKNIHIKGGIHWPGDSCGALLTIPNVKVETFEVKESNT